MLVMLTSNSLKVAIGATFFHFWLTFENFLPRFFNNFFSIFLERSVYAYTCHPKSLQKHATFSNLHGKRSFFCHFY